MIAMLRCKYTKKLPHFGNTGAIFEIFYENHLSSILSTLKITGRVPSEQQHIISFSRFIQPFMMEPPCRPV